MKEDLENVSGPPQAYFDCDACKKETDKSCNTLSGRSLGERENLVDSAHEENLKTAVGKKTACGSRCLCSWLFLMVNITLTILLIHAIIGGMRE